MTLPSVVIFGGMGFFGRRVAADVLARTNCRLVLAGRRAHGASPVGPRATVVSCDYNDPAALRATVAGASVVVHCAGPYRGQRPLLAEAAIRSGAHYVDLAEDGEFIERVNGLAGQADEAQVSLLSGLSVVPGLTALLSTMLATGGPSVDSVRTYVAPGTRGSRGLATVQTLLASAGRELRVWRNGREVFVRGWSEPQWVAFPEPIGRRLLYLAIGTGGSDPVVRELAAQTVEFKAGSEFAWLNRFLAIAAILRSHVGRPKLERWSLLLKPWLKLVGGMGTDEGAVCVEVVFRGRTPGMKRIAVVAGTHGDRIPAVLAAIAVSALLRGEVKTHGAPPLTGWLAPSLLIEEFRSRGLRLWIQEDDFAWSPLHGPQEATA